MASSDVPKRLKWTETAIKCFLEACIDEVSIHGRKGSSLHAESWIRVKNVLNETIKFEVNQKQMKNEYDYLKGKFGAWLYLTKKTGNPYNPATNTFNLTDEEWVEFIKGHPNGKSLKTSPLLFPDLCVSLFEGVAATGDLQWAPSFKTPRPRSSSSSFTSTNRELLQIEDSSGTSREGEKQDHFHPNSNHAFDFEHATIPPGDKESPQSTKFNSGEERPKKKAKPLDKMSTLEDKMSSVLDAIMMKNEGPSYEECVEKLDKIGGDETDDLYVAALGIFLEGPKYRKGWMSLPSDNVDLMNRWIVSVGKKLGY